MKHTREVDSAAGVCLGAQMKTAPGGAGNTTEGLPNPMQAERTTPMVDDQASTPRHYRGNLNTPTPSEVRRAGQYVRPGVRAWKPSPARDRAMRALIFERDANTCRGCGATKNSRYWLELDHIKPYKAGGYFIASNLRLLCQLCNIRKGSHWEGN